MDNTFIIHDLIYLIELSVRHIVEYSFVIKRIKIFFKVYNFYLERYFLK